MNRRMVLIVFAFFSLVNGLVFAQESVEETNKALVMEFIEVVFNEGEAEAAGDYITESYIQNTPGIESGLEALQFSVNMLHTAFPDIRYSITHLAAQGDLVAARLIITGTQTGDFMGIPASGRRVAAAAINFWRVEDGLLAEHWEVLDSLTFLQQLGAIPGGEEAQEGALGVETTPEAIEMPEVAGTPEDNAAVVERLFAEVVNEQNLDVADELMAEDFFWHTGFAAPGREGFKQFYPVIFEAFPDVERTPTLVVAEGDLVFVLNTITGTHEGGEQLYGIPPTGNPITYTSGDVFRLSDGLIVELWDVADYLTLFGQIGLIPAQS
ncbi:MAG: hypothetical protein OHK0046_37430 [Anaerolineae bacterium]